MASRTTLRLETSALDLLISVLPSRGHELVRDLADDVLARTLSRVPVESGELRGSYGLDGGGQDEDTVYVGSPSPNAIHQEFGTSKMSAQPHLLPAVDEVRARLPGKAAELFR